MKKVKRDSEMKTRSGIKIREVYWPENAPDELKSQKKAKSKLGEPGLYPFARGVQKDMYRGRLWTMRQYAGFGTAAESNQRYQYLLAQGTTGLSVAFDLPTQLGYDPDHPRAKGEVGKVGVSISNIEDMKVLFSGIDLSKVSTSMTINATASILLGFYVAVAKEQGAKIKDLRGTVQNDVLKEYVARGNYIYPPKGALRLATDMFSWCSENTPKWNPISVSGYHIREAGATAVQELGFTFANAVAYVQAAVDQGLDIDEFAGQISFFFNVHSDFLEEIAKFRAARVIWAKIMKEQFKAKDPRSYTLRFHTQTAGSTLTAQQPQNNVVRFAIQALAAVLGGTQSLHTNSMDEALALPTESAAQVALRTQQVIAYETGVTHAVDPLGGSWMIESLTAELVEKTMKLLKDIYKKGGTVRCIENGYIQSEISSSAYQDQKKMDEGSIKIVGVNCFNDEKETSKRVDTLKVSPLIEREAVEKIRAFRAKRSVGQVKEVLKSVESGARSDANLQELILNAVQGGATLGEVSDSLRVVFGVYQEQSGI